MPRIAGVDLPANKRVEIALTYIYGIGPTSARKIVADAGIDPITRMRDVTEEESARMREIIRTYDIPFFDFLINYNLYY